MISKILFQGDASPTQVICHFQPKSSRKIDPEIEEKAKNIWQQKLDQAISSGKKMWDQPVYRLDNFLLHDDKFEMSVSIIPFSIRSSVSEFTQDLAQKGDDYLPMALYSTIFIETSDHQLIFGEKSDVYQSNRKYSYIGGVFNPSDNTSQVDPFTSSQNEVTEELGIDPQDIKKLSLIGLLKTVSGNVSMIFYCSLNLSKNEVLAKFAKRQDQEMKNLFFAPPQEVREIGLQKIGKESEFVDIFQKYYDP